MDGSVQPIMKCNIFTLCRSNIINTVVPINTSRAWDVNGWTYHLYDYLDCGSALRLCTVNRAMCEDFREKYMRWKKTCDVSGRRTFVQPRTCGACGKCAASDEDFLLRESNRWDHPGKSYITCNSTECYIKALTSMYTMKTFDCKVDGMWGSVIHTQYTDQDIPKEITVKHELGIATDAVIMSTHRSNKVMICCCGGKLFVKVTWEWKNQKGVVDEYTMVREIRAIWGDRTLTNRATLERFIRRTILNIRDFVRRTRVWGEEVSEMWARAVIALDVIVEMEMEPNRIVAQTISGMVFGARV